MDASSLGSFSNTGHLFRTQAMDPGVSFRNDVGMPARAECRECDKPESVGGDQQASLNYRRTERTSLVIETQEGDVVHLKIKVREGLQANASSNANGSDLSVATRSGMKISFNVEGDLNEDELAAITSVIEQASALAEDFFAGDVPSAFANAASLNIDGDTLAQVALKMSVRERMTYSANSAFQPFSLAGLFNPPAPQIPAPTQNTAESSPVVDVEPVPVPTEPVEAAPVTPEEAIVAEEPAATDAPAVTEPTTQPFGTVQALQTISDFVTALLDSLQAPTADEQGEATTSIHLSLKLRVFQNLVLDLATYQSPDAGSDATTTDGMPLVDSTLDALASQQQPLETQA